MNLYFVRHGESILNAEGRHQFANTPLSKTGIEQAQVVAKRFEKIPVDFIVSSPLKRAYQTAAIIGKTLGFKIHQNVLFKEYKRPSIIEGKFTQDPEAIAIKIAIDDHAEDKNWRFEDGENFYDLKLRGQKCLEYLSKLRHENVVVVTHGAILKMIISILIFRNVVSQEYFSIFSTFLTSNTGITWCSYDKNTNKWYLKVWNDHARFG